MTPALVRQFRPDVILVAVGARREAPSIPGIDRANVLSGDDLRSLLIGGDHNVATAKLSRAQRAMLAMGSLLGVSGRMTRVRGLSRRWMPVGKRVAVIGGGLVGVELAGFFAERGRDVSVLEETPTLAVEMALPRRWRALHELREHGVALLTEARVEALTDDSVVYSRDGERRMLPADTVILATGVRDNPGLAEDLAGLGATVHLVGDCRAVGYLKGALMDAARVARTI